MRFRNDYMYYRPCYSDIYFVTELRFYVKLNDGKKLYFGFDNNHHIKYSEDIKEAAVYINKYPKNYDNYEKVTNRKFKLSLNCMEKVVKRSKNIDYYH